MDWTDKSAVQAYMRDYYRAHSTRPPMVPGSTRAEKVCKRCGVLKKRNEFSVRQSGPRVGHLSAYCKPCSADKVRGTYQVRQDRDPTLYRRVEWPSKLKRRYGITVEDYNRMLAEQGGGCAMCGSTSPCSGARSYKRIKREVFDVDHCHKTGKVRGLLCTRCNRLVGLAGDSVTTARNLVAYLSEGA